MGRENIISIEILTLPKNIDDLISGSK